MIKFKLNNKPLQIPSTWYDPTFEQHLKIMEKPLSTLEVISVFTGIEVEKLRTANIEGLDMVIATLSFLKKPITYDSKLTKIGKYELPLNSKGEFNIQFESLAQFEDMSSAMMKVPDKNALEHTKAYSKYVSIYLQKIRDGKYIPDKAKQMEAEVMLMPAYQVIVLGGFFFIKLLNLLTGTVQTSQNMSPNPKKRKQVLTNSKKRLGRSARS
jgi:hypothetical protein